MEHSVDESQASDHVNDPVNDQPAQSDDDDNGNDDDDELETFVATINQTELGSLASSLREGRPCKIGNRMEGGFNVLFHLHFDDGITWLARFPLSDFPPTKMKSEIATMQYVKERTSIPVPEVYAYDISSNNSIGVPYMLMNKLPGHSLAPEWDGLSDELKRKVLGQIADVLIELSTHRFSKIGSLLLDESGEYHVSELVALCTIDSNRNKVTFHRAPYSTSAEYYLALANLNINATIQQNIGAPDKEYAYLRYWTLRSMVTTFVDYDHDLGPFPLMHGDFNSQNILIDDGCNIVGVIDWEWSSTVPLQSLCQYPCFIVDNPFDAEDEDVTQRNSVYQSWFADLFEKREQLLHQRVTLTNLLRSCYWTYVFEQALTSIYLVGVLYDKLFEYVFGKEITEDYSFSVLDTPKFRDMKEKFDRERCEFLGEKGSDS